MFRGSRDKVYLGLEANACSVDSSLPFAFLPRGIRNGNFPSWHGSLRPAVFHRASVEDELATEKATKNRLFPIEILHERVGGESEDMS